MDADRLCLYFETRAASWALRAELLKQGFTVEQIARIGAGFRVRFADEREAQEALVSMQNVRCAGRRIHRVREWRTPENWPNELAENPAFHAAQTRNTFQP